MFSDVAAATAHAAGQAQTIDTPSLGVSLLFAALLAMMILGLAM